MKKIRRRLRRRISFFKNVATRELPPLPENPGYIPEDAHSGPNFRHKTEIRLLGQKWSEKVYFLWKSLNLEYFAALDCVNL